MEINVLRNFLEIAREGNMTAAAESLHISQPTLSVQMKHLEEELGKKLFVRHSRSLTLTEEGMLLRERASDILDMVDKTEAEFREMNNLQGGDIRIGCAESWLFSFIAQKLKAFREIYPLVRFHITSGDTDIVADRLDRGLLDFAVIVEPPQLEKYNYVEIPGTDTWGVVMRKDNPLSQRERITVDDLIGQDLICSEQSIKADIPRWCGDKADQLNFAGTCNLAYNGVRCVEEDLGLMMTFEHLADQGIRQPLCFRPLEPKLENRMFLIWKKYQIFTPIAEKFLDIIL